MKKTPFTLDAWLRDKSQKVVTAFGEPVQIVFTEGMGPCPILAVIWDGNTTDSAWFTKDGKSGRYTTDEDALFLIEDEPELTEFEKELRQLLDFAITCDTPYDIDCIKTEAAELLAIARKELEKEHGKELLYVCNKTAEREFNRGKAEALKDIPRWRKLDNGAMGCDAWNKPFLIRSSAGHYFLSSSVGPDTVYLELSDLEKLPKDE